MKNIVSIIFCLSIGLSCTKSKKTEIDEDKIWRLGWRMIESSMNQELELADSQFDSLLNFSNRIDLKFLITGLDIKHELKKDNEILEILNNQPQENLNQICQKQFLSNQIPCLSFPKEQVENEALQLELIKMFVDDQAARGNLMNDLISKYNLDTSQITNESGFSVDLQNRNRLKEIIEEFGFPNRSLIGKEGMHGVFLMIQHSDGDKEWQKLQLDNIKVAVKNGDMDGQSYAYLFDRIKVNSGEKQLYGTQFSNVDPINKLVELADTEDLENLDNRRREIGMMPINMYKRYMLKSLEN